jgi:hypothetical protein
MITGVRECMTDVSNHNKSLTVTYKNQDEKRDSNIQVTFVVSTHLALD